MITLGVINFVKWLVISQILVSHSKRILKTDQHIFIPVKKASEINNEKH